MAQIFISYRREGGEALGQLIYEKLTNLGYTVFFDTESMQSEVFSQRLFEEIEQCSDFVLILPRGALDRCITLEEDWVRLEIRHALQRNKHIIPIIMRDFSFPQNLPQDIRDVSVYQGISFETMDFFDARIQRLCEFLHAKPAVLPQPPSPAKRNAFGTFCKAAAARIGAFFGAVWWTVDKICRALWHFRLVRYTVMFFLSALVLYYGIEVVRDTNNANVEQWIRPKYLFEHNAYIHSLAFTDDNALMAVYDGRGNIELHKVLGNTDISETVGFLKSSFADRPVILGFSADSRNCYAVCEDAIEIFNTHTEEKEAMYIFPDYNPEYFWFDIEIHNENDRYTVLWADKGDAGLRKCSFYRLENGVLEQKGALDVTGYSVLGTAAEAKYILLFNSRQKIEIIDTENCSIVENTLEVLANACCGNIDGEENIRQHFDATERYVQYTVRKENGFYDVIIQDMQTGKYIFSRSYFLLNYFTFGQDGTFFVCFDNLSPNGEYKRELHRVNYLAPSELEEVLFSEDILGEYLPGEIWSDVPQNVYILDNTHTMLLAYDNRLHLIDLDKKRRIASCNPLMDHPDRIVSYAFYETDSHVVVSIHSWLDLPEEFPEEFWEYYLSLDTTAIRFSFEKNGKNITVREDAYAESKEPNNLLMLTLSVLGLSVYLYTGRRTERRGRP